MAQTKSNRERTRYVGQMVASGDHGDVIVSREFVESVVEQLQASPKPVGIEHNPTNPPVGRLVGGRLVELPDGEVAAESVIEVYDETQTVVLHSHEEFVEACRALPGLIPEDGPLRISIDKRSYDRSDIETLLEEARSIGQAESGAEALRFSQLPDPLLIIALGAPATAGFWFAKGFFTKIGEVFGREVGEDLLRAYAAFKARLRTVITERRNPIDRPPITMFQLLLERRDGEMIEVEGSTRADGEELESFLDSGSDLLPVALAYLALAAEPDQLRKMHFRHTKSGWQFAYGLDDEAEPVMIVVLSEEAYAQALEEAKRNTPD
jgi:hypothetical protein